MVQLQFPIDNTNYLNQRLYHYDARAINGLPNGTIITSFTHVWTKQVGSVVQSEGDVAVAPLNNADTNSAPAMSFWSQFLGIPLSLHLTVRTENLPVGELGETQIDAIGACRRPLHHRRHHPSQPRTPTAASAGTSIPRRWTTPSSAASRSAPDVFQATAGSPAAGKYDLFTVLLHEIGHVLAFDSDIPGFIANLGIVAGSEVFTGPGFTAQFASSGDDLNPNLFPNDLMKSRSGSGRV